MKAENVLRAHVVFHDHPLGRILHFIQRLLLQEKNAGQNASLDGVNDEFGRYGFSRFIQEGDGATCTNLLKGPADVKGQRGGARIIMVRFQGA